MKVLVVDDSQVIRRILTNILNDLKAENVEIIEAGDGKEALDVLTSGIIDLVLLDWNMPKMNGLDLIKTVRKMPDYEKTPIIMITSEAAKYNVMEAIKAGVSDYVVKPIKSVELIQKLKQFI